ncbi:ATP-binding protein [Bacillus sp. JJ722]
MVLTSNYCDKHTYFLNGEVKVKPIQMMILDGQELCPKCGVEKETQKLEESENQRIRQVLENRNQNILYKQSIITDETILKASFENFVATQEEEIKNKQLCLDALKQLKQGQVFNVLLIGNQGAGKSHLAYSMLNELNSNNNVSCLFISVEEAMRLIKSSFNDKGSKYTEQYFVSLMSSVDYLVLDDLGAETGAINTEKTATDFVQRVLYAVSSARQSKVTITTTNLSSETLFNMYDKKLVSRLMKKPKFILFKNTKDKRISSLPF